MRYSHPVFEMIASAAGALKRCRESANTLWEEKWESILEQIENHILPSGSGIDSGCKIDRDKTTENVIVITLGYHHMNENGFYDGWTEHTIKITPAFIGKFDMRISGRNRNDIKEYLSQVFDCDLRAMIELDENNNVMRAKEVIVNG